MHGLEIGATRLGLRLKLSHAQRDALVDDASGDALDAVLCLVQAAWAQQQFDSGDRCYRLTADHGPVGRLDCDAPERPAGRRLRRIARRDDAFFNLERQL